jgi:predicted RNA-binding Zn-ribbon protein involved in translation (DUF1610 family)
MSMFCEIAGQGHPVRNLEPITHYVRHSCPRCGHMSITGMCTACAKVFRAYIDKGWGAYTWCPKCKRSMEANLAWTLYESVAE